MSTPSPTFVFQVDLTALYPNSFLNPDLYTESPTLGRANRDNHKATRVTWVPGLVPGKNYELHHGQQITEYGLQGNYLYKQYCNVPNPILTLVSRA